MQGFVFIDERLFDGFVGQVDVCVVEVVSEGDEHAFWLAPGEGTGVDELIGPGE